VLRPIIAFFYVIFSLAGQVIPHRLAFVVSALLSGQTARMRRDSHDRFSENAIATPWLSSII
jgi:hypothetical protein